MNINGYTGLFAALVIVLVCAAGCTTPQTPGAATPAPSVTTAITGSPQNPQTTSSATTATKTTNIDTMVNVHFNDIACLDIQKEMGVSYLYPDQKYKLTAASPSAAAVNVNVVVVDYNDNLKLGQTRPQWDSLQKTWLYPGLVPVVQFNDITVPQEKTFTIKTQSKYYICVDDRKETGINDIMLRVPVTLTRLS
ncbi:MAG: hypothetical protein Q8N94_08600 [Methanoregula sp.]|nr:hypothetical protein [Methanoregula sp.]